MSYDEEILSQFDQYDADEMSIADREAFEKRLEKDEELASKYQDYQHLKRGINEYSYQQFAGKMKEWEDELLLDKDEKSVPLNKKWYMLAASVVILILSVISFTQLTGDLSSEEIFASNFEPYPDIITDRGAGRQLLNEGLYKYESGEYEAAIKDLRKYLADNSEKKEVLFYLGQSYLANGETSKALDIFNSLTEAEDFKLQEANEWYRALAYIKMENTKTAQKILQLIQGNTDHAYRERSEKLLEKLN